MGYVSAYCCVCGGPIDHGYGFDGALEELNENLEESEERDTSKCWMLPLASMRWLEELVVLSDTTENPSPILRYEDYGMASSTDIYKPWDENDEMEEAGVDEEMLVMETASVPEDETIEDFESNCDNQSEEPGTETSSFHQDDADGQISNDEETFSNDQNGTARVEDGVTHWGLNVCAWGDTNVGFGTPGIPCHADCCTLLERELEAASLNLRTFFCAYYAEVNGRYQSLQDLKASGSSLTPQQEQEDGTFLSTFIPGINYGEEKLPTCEQFYELQLGEEWLLSSPILDEKIANDPDAAFNNQREQEWSSKNRTRIKAVISELIQKVVQKTN